MDLTWRELAAAGFAALSPQDCRSSNVRATVRDKTWEGYASEARNMIYVAMAIGQFLREKMHMNDPPEDSHADIVMYYIAHNVSKNFYSTYIHGKSEAGIRNIRLARCALLKAQEVFGCQTWARDTEIILETDGAESRAAMLGPRPSSIGAIDIQMLGELVDNVGKAGGGLMRKAMLVQFGAALRYGELMAIRPKDVTDLGVYLRQPKQDKARYDFNSTPRMKKLVAWEYGKKSLNILHQLKKDRDPNRELFGGAWPATVYNQYIKNTKIQAGWPQECRIRGSHSLRHGGVGVAVEEMEGKYTMSEMSDILLMSEAMIKHYRASNAERGDRDVRMEEKRQDWVVAHQNTLLSERQLIDRLTTEKTVLEKPHIDWSLF
eukprot:GILJ01026135.1.p1 GENE.GILJ01026135.1~~GILJ01026135.1.p1  ORF type:complete len:377 (-),score=28.21 GILJ01026135.1:841-1971(-)